MIRRWSSAGLTNYWGYNTIGFFAPEAKYSSSGDLGGQVSEFKTMVRNLHAAGIEVILDVVYNHTAEGSQLGPTLAFRGIDNIASYRLRTENPRFDLDFTGTGNTFNLLHPRTLQLVMDSLRYWVLEMHVDGFRFDLASTLARDTNGVNKLHAFFEIIHQDPVLSQVKLIAEPWDVGEGGYQVGNFPASWAEWNGKYRDAIRSFWKGDEGRIGEVAYRLTGSPDLYQHDGRRRTPVSILSPHTMDSPSQIWLAITRNTTKRTARRTTTGIITICRGITARRGRLKIQDQRVARTTAAKFSDHAFCFTGRADAARRR